MSELDIYAGNEMSYRDYYLSHYGVKGMKWGVRKKRDSSSDVYKDRNNRKPTTDEIKAARRRTTKSYRKVEDVDFAFWDKREGSKVNPSELERHAKTVQKMLKDIDNSADAIKGSYMTKGEKVATGILLAGSTILMPPVGVGAGAGVAINRLGAAKSRAKAREYNAPKTQKPKTTSRPQTQKPKTTSRQQQALRQGKRDMQVRDASGQTLEEYYKKNFS